MSSGRTLSLERKRQALELFDQALELSAVEKPAFLDQVCGDDSELRWEVESLLETEEDQGILCEPAFSVHAEDASIGRQIGNYKLVRLLDRGGMGAVYLAEREDFEKRVALKLIRRGLDMDEVLVHRFHNERQILARLEHPHIASLLDGGTTTDHLPYFVMEYVEGEPIDRFCESRALSIDERLELFREVCSAVQFAHQNLVVHRDLKPGNILITSTGKPKLLDFGIAKLLDHGLAARAVTTQSGQGLMTPRYASPEQIRLEPITTASDVYTLGVLLYELLTGLDPYHVDTGRSDELARAICDQEPDKPSTAVRRRSTQRASDPRKLRRRLSGDLDSIVLKAMRKEPHERYNSAEQLSEDLRRHLKGLPVAARVGSFTYHADKFVRRHKLALSVSMAFLLLSLIFSIVSTVFWGQAVREREVAERQRQVAERQRQVAEHQRQRAETASQFLKELFKSANPDEARGEKLTALELLERGKQKIVEEREGEPELQMELAGALGEVFHNLGAYDESKELMELSLRFARQHYGGDHPEVAKRIGNLASLFKDHSRAEELYREALAMRLRLGERPSKFSRLKGNLATVLMFQGEFDEAEKLYREVLDIRKELYEPEFGPDDEDVATSHRNLGALYYAKGDFEQAEPQLREALKIRRRVFEAGHTRIASVLNLLGNVLAAQGRQEEARQLFEETLTIRDQRLGDDHLLVARTKKDLAALLAQQDPDTARGLLTPALAILEQANPESWEVADGRSVLGAILASQGRYEEAELLLIKSHARLEKIKGKQAFSTRRALGWIHDLNINWGKPERLGPH